MKIDVSTIDISQFAVKPVIFDERKCFLINPSGIDTRWNPDNMHFRSSIWTEEGELISAGFRKFFNWNEHPLISPHPSDMRDVELIEKIDGSCLILSRFRGCNIVRTRGKADVSEHNTGYEIEILAKQYPRVFEWTEWTAGYTRLFEWTTPANKIVLDYGDKPDIWYIGKIYHEDYRYAPQKELDEEAVELGVKRPKRYNFHTIPEMLETVDKFKGVEGVCVYYDRGQEIRKVKGAEYLAMHRFKSGLSFENSVDMFVEMGMPDYQNFEKKIKEQFDFECFEYIKGYASKLCDAKRETDKMLDAMHKFIWEKVKPMPTRKEQAMAIKQNYGDTNRASMAFHMLDDKPMGKDYWKKLLYQMEKNR